MDGSVDLEHQAEFVAIEIDDKAPEDVLATEFEAEHPTVAYQVPGFALGRGRVLAELPGEFGLVVLRFDHPQQWGWSVSQM